MRLSKENIKYIDKHLQDIDIKQIDIRMEIVDHIASAIEVELKDNKTDFQTCFKVYMLNNKAEILEQKQKFLKRVYVNCLKRIINYCYSLKGIIIFIIFTTGINLGFIYLGEPVVKFIVVFFAIFIFILLFTSLYGISYTLKLSKISSVDRLGVIHTIVLFLLNTVFILTENINDWVPYSLFISILLAVFMTFSIAFLVVGYKILGEAEAYKKIIKH